MTEDYDLNFSGFGRRVSTKNETAQVWFDRAYTNMMGFNHEEAIRLYGIALQHDENLAMAYWGIAHSFIGNYNNPGGLGGLDTSREYVLKAVALLDGVTEVEKTLIEALLVRCPEEGASENPLKDYANHMRGVYEMYNNDCDVIALFADSLMNLAPWNLWTPKSSGSIEPTIPETLEVKAALEHGLSIDPTHPGLCHYYIHLMELSAEPAKALPAADNLRTRITGQGHLVHMPSHIDIWVGQYKEAAESSVVGVDADEKYVEITGNESNFYKFYRMHNYHFVAWAAMLDGQFDLAIDYARRMEKQLNSEHVQFMLAGTIPLGAIFLEAFTIIPFHVLVRFGKWEEILNEPIPTEADIFPTKIATAHYARGVAYASLGQVDKAEAELQAYRLAMENPALNGRMLHNNVVIDREGEKGILQVGESLLKGEIEYRKGNYEEAYDNLREAVRRDADLKYDEPWGWMTPSRHALGALLLEQGHYDEAKAVFEADLDQFPNNLWSLRGLLTVLKQSGASEDEVARVEKRKTKSEARAESFECACYCANSSCIE
jgi:tetratricopeptide (TPR) repeat protein